MKISKTLADTSIVLAIAVATFLILKNLAAPQLALNRQQVAAENNITLETDEQNNNFSTTTFLFPASSRRALLTQDNKTEIPILMFHYIRNYTDPKDPLGQSLSVTPKEFEKYLRWLKEHDYQAVNPAYFLQAPATVKKPIIITLDDGYEDAYTNVYPLLKKHNFTGTFYIITNKVGTAGYLTWKQIKEMKENGMNIGSHTLHHWSATSLKPQVLEKELQESKKILEEHLQGHIEDFCYPYGFYNAQTTDALRVAGYKTAVTTEKGINKLDSDLLTLKRNRLGNYGDIIKALSGL